MAVAVGIGELVALDVGVGSRVGVAVGSWSALASVFFLVRTVLLRPGLGIKRPRRPGTLVHCSE